MITLLLFCALAWHDIALDAVRAEIATEAAAREYERMRPQVLPSGAPTVLWCRFAGLSAARDFAKVGTGGSKVSDALAGELCLRFYLSRGGVREDMPAICVQVMVREFQRVYRRFYIQELKNAH